MKSLFDRMTPRFCLILITFSCMSVTVSRLQADEPPEQHIGECCERLELLCAGEHIEIEGPDTREIAGDDERRKRRKKRRRERQVEYVLTDDGVATPADVATACKKHAYLSGARERCYAVGRKFPSRRRAAEAITACGEATSLDDGFVHCLKRAMQLEGQQVRTIKACDEISYIDSNMNDCMDMVAEFGHHSVGRTLEACIAHTYLDSNVPDCMQAASRLSRDQAEVVNACAAGSPVDSSLIECIERSSGD